MLHQISNYKDSGINEKNREEISKILSILVADHFVLFTKILQFHWNIRGSFFGPLHQLFEEGYDFFYKSIDDIAERIVQLGFLAPGSMEEFKSLSTIKEHVTKNIDSNEMLKILVNDVSFLIKEMRKIIIKSADFDPATNNKITDKIEIMEKYLWKLQSHLL